MFAEVDVFILPSNDEADSVAIKEAIASGTPVVISHECKINSDELSDKFIKDSINPPGASAKLHTLFICCEYELYITLYMNNYEIRVAWCV